LVSG
jgi:magnesium transporter